MSADNQELSNITPLAKYKIAFLGDEQVGKTSLINCFTSNSFDKDYKATVGIDFFSKTLYLQDKALRLQLWDTSGEKRFAKLIPSYIRGSSVAVIVFDVNKRSTYKSVEQWIEQVRQMRNEQENDAHIVLVGSQIDLEGRDVSKEEAQAFANEQNIIYHEVSAKSGVQVKPLFLETIAPLLLAFGSDLQTVEENYLKPQSVRFPEKLSPLDQISELAQSYENNGDVQAIVHLLQKGLAESDPQAFFNRQFAEDTPEDNLRTHLNKLAWSWKSILNTVVNVVIGVLQTVYAGVHALGYCIRLVEKQNAAYPSFWAFGEKQAVQKLGNKVLEAVKVPHRM